MLLEATQMIATNISLCRNDRSHFLYGYDIPLKKDGTPYKPCHQNHPCTIWVRENEMNYNYLLRYARAMANEFEYRFGKKHACDSIIFDLIIKSRAPWYLSTDVEFIACIADKYSHCLRYNDSNELDVIESYRCYYSNKDIRKTRTKRETPLWQTHYDIINMAISSTRTS